MIIERSFLAAAALALLPVGAGAQEDTPRLEPTDLGDGIYMLSGGGGNVGLFAGDDGVFVIDDSYAPVTDQMIEFARQVAGGPIRFVLNTHWHHDHTGGNETVGEAGSLILSHDNTRARLTVEQILAPPMSGGSAPAFPEVAWPVITFSEDVSFHLNGQEVRAFHVPEAHTDGDVVVYFTQSDVIHMGDVLISLGFPIIDHGAGGTLAGMLAAHERVYDLAGPDTRIIAGHGPMVGREFIGRYVAMLRRVRDILTPLMNAGLEADEVVTRQPLAELRDDWAGGFVSEERMIRQVMGAGR